VGTRLSIVVPFHRGLSFLDRALRGLVPLRPADELLIAADGAVDDCHALAAKYNARVVEIPGPRGPAAARNAAASCATGDVLLFVDADVVASPHIVERVARLLETRPDVSAVFGAYDDAPADPGFFSTYKNLAHSYVHRAARGEAETFWAGFGAVRREAFDRVGGFDERFTRPSIEDIDLGYRLTGAGFRVHLDPALAVCHLKRWTFWSMLRSDVLDRGIPWTQLIARYRRFGGLNATSEGRACVLLAYLSAAAAVLGVIDARFLWLAAALAGGVLYLGRDYYRYFRKERGLWFALRVVPLHFLYHLYNGLSFGIGMLLFVVARTTGLVLPGALPPSAREPSGDAPRADGRPSSAASLPTGR
jgi:GT2 family glycosyltransferase